MNLNVYNTHMEISPYKQGDLPQLEKRMSKYDDVTHRYEPITYYIEDDVLYLPRGCNLERLESYCHNTATINYKSDTFLKLTSGEPIDPPKSDIQQDAINFLSGETDRFMYTRRFHQLGLNLDTGDGKTYAAIYSILKTKSRAIIITHQDKIKNQWIETFSQRTTVPEENICNITSSNIMDKIMDGEITGEIFLVNHQTLQSYARKYDWKAVHKFFKKIKVGVKIIDESHKYFRDSFLIDSFSNTDKTYYLTATFGRSDEREKRVYNTAFSSLIRFGEETLDYKDKRKHIIFVIVYYRSSPDLIPTVRTSYGFSAYKYIDYELKEGVLINVFHNILDSVKHMDGKIIVLSPKKSTVDFFTKEIKKHIGTSSIGTIYSNNTSEVNDKNKNKKYISSTVKSIGTGTDIKGLRVMIDLEPVTSKALADQVRGRLREYSDTYDTYLFYPVDTSIPEMMKGLERILPVMKRKCKQVVSVKM